MSSTLSSIGVTAAANESALLAAIIKDQYPDVDVSPGTAVYDLLLRLEGYLQLSTKANIDSIKANWNVKAIQANPSAAPTGAVDGLLSNFGVSRITGGTASGNVEVGFDVETFTVIPQGTAFTTATGLTFLSTISVSTVSWDPQSIYQRKLSVKADGTYYVLVPVQAAAVGAAYNVSYNTQFTTTSTIVGSTYLKANRDFTGGVAAQTNEELVSTIAKGVPTKMLSGRQHAESLALSILADSMAAASCVGAGDFEMLRGCSLLTGQQLNGRADLIVRTAAQLETAVATVACTVSDGVVTLEVPNEYLHGAYLISKVMLSTADPLVTDAIPITSVTWERYGTEHDILDAKQAAFSCYQTATVVLDAPAAVEGTEYDVYILRAPNLELVQAACESAEYSDPLADWVVRAATPVIVDVTLTIKRQAGQTLPTGIAGAVASVINAQSFVSELDVSPIIAAVQTLLPKGMTLSLPVVLSGLLVDNTHATYRIGGTQALSPSLNAYKGVSAKTLAYFTSADRVHINEQVNG